MSTQLPSYSPSTMDVPWMSLPVSCHHHRICPTWGVSASYCCKHALLAGICPACNEGDPASIPRSGRSAGAGIGYPLQYSWAPIVVQLVFSTPVFWLGEFHGLNSPCSCEEWDTTVFNTMAHLNSFWQQDLVPLHMNLSVGILQSPYHMEPDFSHSRWSKRESKEWSWMSQKSHIIRLHHFIC